MGMISARDEQGSPHEVLEFIEHIQSPFDLCHCNVDCVGARFRLFRIRKRKKLRRSSRGDGRSPVALGHGRHPGNRFRSHRLLVGRKVEPLGLGRHPLQRRTVERLDPSGANKRRAIDTDERLSRTRSKGNYNDILNIA